MTFNWTEERVAKMREMVADGKLYGEIAEALGCSRNSAIGKGHRLGIKASEVRRVSVAKVPVPTPAPAPAPVFVLTGSPWTADELERAMSLRKSGMMVRDIAVAIGRPFESTKRKLREAGCKLEADMHRKERTPAPWIAQKVERPDGVVSIFDLRADSCRWSFGDVGADDFGFCGERVMRPGCSWCDVHYRLAFVPSSYGRRRVA